MSRTEPGRVCRIRKREKRGRFRSVLPATRPLSRDKDVYEGGSHPDAARVHPDGRKRSIHPGPPSSCLDVGRRSVDHDIVAVAVLALVAISVAVDPHDSRIGLGDVRVAGKSACASLRCGDKTCRNHCGSGC